jgi:hypothetical protein
MDVV